MCIVRSLFVPRLRALLLHYGMIFQNIYIGSISFAVLSLLNYNFVYLPLKVLEILRSTSFSLSFSLYYTKLSGDRLSISGVVSRSRWLLWLFWSEDAGGLDRDSTAISRMLKINRLLQFCSFPHLLNLVIVVAAVHRYHVFLDPFIYHIEVLFLLIYLNFYLPLFPFILFNLNLI